MKSKNENIANNENMTYEQRIEVMKTNLGNKFKEEGKRIIKDAKVIKGEETEENFNTELNELTFEIEELYPLNYNEFKKEFPKTIELVDTVGGGVVKDAVDKGTVTDGWKVRTNVDETINNIKTNVKDEKVQKDAIQLREDVFSEIQRMEKDFGIEWVGDLFYKCWHIKEGQARWNYLVKTKGEKVAKKKIDNIRKVGGMEFIEVLKEEIYGKK